jgi:hypothetical protein
MKKLSIFALIVMMMALVAGAAQAQELPSYGAGVLLSGAFSANEVPEPGDENAGGFVDLSVNGATGDICYSIAVTGIDAATASHIHAGFDGESGDVVLPLATPDADGIAADCVNDAELAIQLIDSPWSYYVNVHNEDFPGGAARAQLGSVESYIAALSGINEVNDLGEIGQGDDDATGAALVAVYPDRGQVCFDIRVNNIDSVASAAHIHEGTFGLNGPVLVGLAAPGEEGTVSGCAEADADSIALISENPTGFYVNVHNDEFPGGALRGQLNVYGALSASISGAASVGNPGDEDGTGAVLLSIDPLSGQICGVATLNNIDPLTASHIHVGSVSESGNVVQNLDITGGCQPLNTDVVLNVIANPEGYYVNTHNEAFPAGAARGQTVAGEPMVANLSGGSEVPGPGDDGFGYAALLLNVSNSTVCTLIAVEDVTAPTAAHIHIGAEGEAGDVVIALEAPAESVDGTVTCVEGDISQIVSTLADPANYYVNIHNEEFPAGAVRGQISNAR